MLRKIAVFLLLSSQVFLAGCALLVAGAAVGAGAYTYHTGELTRPYQAQYDPTVNACNSALRSLNFKIVEKLSDGIKTEFKAERADGTPVTVKVVMMGARITEVGVRSGYVGVWDQEVSQLIHSKIAERL